MWCAALLWLAFCLCPLAGAAPVDESTVPASRTDADTQAPLPSRIVRIAFEGNKVTREVILRQELWIKEGDAADAHLIERSRQAIMNLGLFKSVTTRLEDTGEGLVLYFSVEEKFYILPIPKLKRDSDGDIKYGLELRLDNLLGYNQRLTLIWENREIAGADDEREYGASYEVPRFVDSEYGLTLAGAQVDSYVRKEDEFSQVGEYRKVSDKFSFSISRWLAQHAPSEGYRASMGASWQGDTYTRLSGPPGLYEDRKRLLGHLEVSYTKVRERKYDREGRNYGVRLSLSGKRQGSDDSFGILELYYRKYRPAIISAHDNLNYQFKLGLGNGIPEDEDAFTLGSSTTLRGYARDSIAGDSFILANVEYLRPVFGQRSLRGVLFTDIGNAYPENEIDLSDWEVAAGIGLRWKIRAFVKTDLRIDAGYAFGQKDTKVYFGSKNTF